MIVYASKENTVDIIDQRNTMYPTYAVMVNKLTHTVYAAEVGWATMMGYSYGETDIHVGGKLYDVGANSYFSIPVRFEDIVINPSDKLFAVFRLGFIGHELIGKVEQQGRLSYIDGCSDSLLVYPPRLGDASLNLLYFPKNINQSYHTHPSIRIGCVISGEGFSDTAEGAKILGKDVLFCLTEQELHRFRTENDTMRIIAYHPDGDWGPTDENHTMLNRTYIKK